MPAPPPSSSDTQAAAQVSFLVTAQAAARAALTAQAVQLAVAAAGGFTGWYAFDEVTAWSAQLAARVEAIQRAIAQSTDAYLARALSQITGRRVRPVGRVDVDSLRHGITHADAYARAAGVYRWQQSRLDTATRDLLTAATPEPPDLSSPVAAAVDRVSAVADMDAQLADQAQSQKVYVAAAAQGLITGWRRVIHPELSQGGSCGLCIVASDRLYGPHEVRPLHDRCECTTLPVREHVDPGSALNRDDLDRYYKEAGGTGRDKLKRTRYQVDEHGELGPLLNPKGATVRTPRQARRDTGDPAPPRTEAQKRATLERLHAENAASLAKARDLAAADPAKWSGYLRYLEGRTQDLSDQLAG